MIAKFAGDRFSDPAVRLMDEIVGTFDPAVGLDQPTKAAVLIDTVRSNRISPA
jgi:hypothetical protein